MQELIVILSQAVVKSNIRPSLDVESNLNCNESNLKNPCFIFTIKLSVVAVILFLNMTGDELLGGSHFNYITAAGITYSTNGST